MEDTAFERLIREIEIEKGKREGHEAVCAERYKAIENRFGSFEKKLDTVINQALESGKSLDGWKMWALAGAFAVLVALTAGSVSALYTMQTKQIEAASAHR